MRIYLKSILIFCIVIFMVIPVYSIFAKEENTVITDPNLLNELKPVIDEYFAAYFDSIKTGNSENLVKLINDNKLKEYTDLLVTSRYSYFEKLDQKLYDYDFTSYINYVRVNESKYIVDVKLDSSLIYENDKASQAISKGDNYLFILDKEKDRWFINSIIYDINESADPNKINDENYINNKLKTLKDDIKDMDKRVKEVKTIQNNIKNSDQSKASDVRQTIVSSPDGSTITYNRE